MCTHVLKFFIYHLHLLNKSLHGLLNRKYTIALGLLKYWKWFTDWNYSLKDHRLRITVLTQLLVSGIKNGGPKMLEDLFKVTQLIRVKVWTGSKSLTQLRVLKLSYSKSIYLVRSFLPMKPLHQCSLQSGFLKVNTSPHQNCKEIRFHYPQCRVNVS